jgi:hypothetical protein
MAPPLTAAERQQLTLELLQRFFQDCDECEKALGYHPTRFREMLADLGPIETARRVIISPQIPEGFSILWEKGRLDLTTEVKVLSRRFCRLFAEDLLLRARKRLQQYNYPDLSCPCLDEC